MLDTSCKGLFSIARSNLWEDFAYVFKDLLVIKHCHVTIMHFSQFISLLNNELLLINHILLDLFKKEICSLSFLGFHSLQSIQEALDTLWFLDWYFQILAFFQDIPMIGVSLHSTNRGINCKLLTKDDAQSLRSV